MNLGINSKSKEVLVKDYSSKLTQALLGSSPSELLVILDGTYIYCQKSSNYGFQRKTYSMHKYRNLIKPMMLVTTTGYIIDIFGPYPGNKNDATIIKELVNEKAEFNEFLSTGELAVIVDRGFRDCIELFADKNIPCHMPSITSQKQLETVEANRTRLVTKCRWPVEAINGQLKTRFRFLDHVVQNASLYNVMDDVKIAGALLNYTYKPLVSDEDDPSIARKMLSLVNKPNRLLNLVKERNFDAQRKPFTKLDSSQIPDFPVLSLVESKNITLGSYQLKQSLSYIAQHLNENDNKGYIIEVYKEPSEYIVRARIRSRHQSQAKYLVYVQYDPTKPGDSAIQEWCCRCRNGLRTVGCCSHIASLIYYLAYGRYRDDPHPAVELVNIFPEIPPVYEESDED